MSVHNPGEYVSSPESSLLTQLLQESMQRGKLPYLVVTGDSMKPLLRTGDRIQVEAAGLEQLQPGDILVLAEEVGFISHRYWGTVTRGSEVYVTTRGDRALQFDPPCPPSKLFGRAITRQRDRHYLSLRKGAGRWLNHQLARLAALEMRLFAITTAGMTATNTSAAGRASRSALPARLLRRIFFVWAVLLERIVSFYSRWSK